MPEHSSNEHSIFPNMASSTGDSPLYNEVAVPATSNKGNTTTRDNEESASTTSQAMTRSYCHVLSVIEIIELAKRLDIHGSVGQDKVDTVKNCEGSQQDDKHTATPVDIDMPACAQDGKSLALDSEPIVCQQSGAASAPQSQSPSTGETSIKTDLSICSTKPSTKSASESDNEALTTSQPVPVVYPPRRPNIFNKRAPQRNVRWGPELVAAETTHATEDVEKDGDGLTEEELQEFQSEREAHMGQKTERFLRMVSQYSWQPRVVEDLGEVFALED